MDVLWRAGFRIQGPEGCCHIHSYKSCSLGAYAKKKKPSVGFLMLLCFWVHKACSLLVQCASHDEHGSCTTTMQPLHQNPFWPNRSCFTGELLKLLLWFYKRLLKFHQFLDPLCSRYFGSTVCIFHKSFLKLKVDLDAHRWADSSFINNDKTT